MTLLSATIEAHGVGGQKDLPIPLELAIAGAVAALVLSFAVLILAWREPKYAVPTQRPAPRLLTAVVGSAWFPALLRVLGFAAFLLTVALSVFGGERATNPFLGIVYVYWWVGIAFASLLLGPAWKAISPVRTINAALNRLTGGDPEVGIRDYPARLGMWPAAVGLFAFVWLELVYPHNGDVPDVRLWCGIYLAVMLVGGAIYGNRFYEYADPFEVYSTLMSRVSPWAVVDGRLVLRSPLANLATTPATAGLIAVVGTLFGSTAFDSFGESPWWARRVYYADLTAPVMNTLGLLAFCVLAAALFAIGCALTGVGDEPGAVRRSQLPGVFAHSLLPIIAAYIFAHYATSLLEYGQQILAQLGDPFGEGWNLLGLGNIEQRRFLSQNPTLLAMLKVFAVVAGHVSAAVLAHDRALTVLPKRHQVTGQLPLLLTMVAFTAGGLYLLFSA